MKPKKPAGKITDSGAAVLALLLDKAVGDGKSMTAPEVSAALYPGRKDHGPPSCESALRKLVADDLVVVLKPDTKQAALWRYFVAPGSVVSCRIALNPAAFVEAVHRALKKCEHLEHNPSVRVPRPPHWVAAELMYSQWECLAEAASSALDTLVESGKVKKVETPGYPQPYAYLTADAVPAQVLEPETGSYDAVQQEAPDPPGPVVEKQTPKNPDAAVGGPRSARRRSVDEIIAAANSQPGLSVAERLELLRKHREEKSREE